MSDEVAGWLVDFAATLFVMGGCGDAYLSLKGATVLGA
jgi:hypothetical protein